MYRKEIIAEIESGLLTVEAHDVGTRYIHYKVYSKTKGEWVEKLNLQTGEVTGKIWLGDFERYDIKAYPKIHYMAMKNKNQGYRINKTIYEKYKK